MKKIYKVLLLISIICLPIVYFMINQVHEAFPHAKQYLIKSIGSITLYENEPVRLSFALIDEKDFSEFKSNDNIEKIEVLYSNKKLNIHSFNLVELSPTDVYFCKMLELVVVEKEISEVHQLDAIHVFFKDGVIEEFPIGDLNFQVKKRENNGFLYNLSEDHLLHKEGQGHLTGWIISLQNLSKAFQIKDIDFGVSGMHIKLNDFEVFEGMQDIDVMNYYGERRRRDDPTPYDDIILGSPVDIVDFQIQVDSGTDQVTDYNAYVFNIIYDENFDFTSSIYLNPEYTIADNTSEFKIHGAFPTAKINPYNNTKYFKERLEKEGR